MRIFAAGLWKSSRISETQIDQWMLLISSDRQTDKDDIDHVANNFIARISLRLVSSLEV